ncbi:unnamed protein product [Rotaria sp. Silwood1]|nr:unnamed protein product [Rotaria sp. Silwood1]
MYRTYYTSRYQTNLYQPTQYLSIQYPSNHYLLSQYLSNQNLSNVYVSNELSYDIHAPQKAIHRIEAQSDAERKQFIIDTFMKLLGDGIRENPKAFRGRFRKMAESAFKFYCGSAVLFYQDLKVDQDQFIARNTAAGQIFIHGDLHAENFGTYMDNHGILNFDVNDFDEGYVGSFTWDVKHLLASRNLVCHRKEKNEFSLTLRNISGKIEELLNKARIKTNVDCLQSWTTVQDFEQKLTRLRNTRDVDELLRADLMHAFKKYYNTIPDIKKDLDKRSYGEGKYKIKDVVSSLAQGIGSAGKITYTFLLEGQSEALESDVILYMKPAQKSAISYVVRNPSADGDFKDDGLRIVLCSNAMQASTPEWLGYTKLDGVPFIVDTNKAHSEDLDWSDIDNFQDVIEVVQYLGRAMGKND